MNYKEVTDYIFNLGRFGGIKLGLERIEYLLNAIGNPHKKLKFIHVGGTAGKGSTVAMIASILKEAGYKIGRYTSPHLSSFTERIVVNDERISEDEVVRQFEELKPLVDEMEDKPTFFELATAIALKYFYQQKVDFAVLEVGLGGRLDATNVVTPLVSVITNIGLEHTEILGNTVEEIAKEKAGIIKENGIFVTAVDDKVYSILYDICKQKNCKIIRVDKEVDFNLGLLGDYQKINAAVALAVINELKKFAINISEDVIKEGLLKVKWSGRFEIMQENPFVILDCAKDPLSMNKLASSLKSYFADRDLILVISISSDKKISLMLKEIVPLSKLVVITKHKVADRAADVSLIANEVEKYGKGYLIVEDVKQAVGKALEFAEDNDIICVTGSVFTVGEARELWYPEKVLWGREFNEIRLKI